LKPVQHILNKSMIKFTLKSLIISLGVFFLSSFLKSKVTYQTECISIQSDGSVAFKIWDTKKGDKYTSEQARKDAIHAVLFSSVSGGAGCTTQPPILNTSEEQNNFKAIEKSFFAKNGKWAVYTRNSTTETTLPTSLGENNWKVYQVSVSKNELRNFLEEQKVIKSLNQGF